MENAFAWYEGKRPGLGKEFLERVDQAVNQIAKSPLAARKVIDETRRVNLRQFPYALWYRVETDSIVIACLHAKRDFALAKKRALSLPEP